MGKALMTQVWGPDSIPQTHAQLQSQCPTVQCVQRQEALQKF